MTTMIQRRIGQFIGGALMALGVGGFWWEFNEAYTHRSAAFVVMVLMGFFILVACVLVKVFGSAHTSQDDAYRKGREVEANLQERKAEQRAEQRKHPVVVPLHRRDLDHILDAVDHVHELQGHQHDSSEVRLAAWWQRHRAPVVAIGLSTLAVLGVAAAAWGVEPVKPAAPVLHRGVPGSPAQVVAPKPDVTASPAQKVARVARVNGGPTPTAQAVPTSRREAPSKGVQASRGPAAVPAIYVPDRPRVAAPAASPAAPKVVVPLTPAEQTAKTAADAAASTAATAKAAAEATAAKAAADAERVRLQAAADAWAVAHPGG